MNDPFAKHNLDRKPCAELNESDSYYDLSRRPELLSDSGQKGTKKSATMKKHLCTKIASSRTFEVEYKIEIYPRDRCVWRVASMLSPAIDSISTANTFIISTSTCHVSNDQCEARIHIRETV